MYQRAHSHDDSDMKYQVYKACERGLKDQGWLQSNFVFSFSNFYNPVRSGFGLLRVFNDDYLKPGTGFGIHPHANMEIISILLQGTMNHIDSLGYKETLQKDSVQIMSAGSGLRHEEYNVGEDQVNFIQLWIEPKVQNITPRYQRRYFPEADRHNKLVTVVSSEEGQAHCWINQNATISLGYFDAGNNVPYSFNPVNKCVFIYNISGTLKLNNVFLDERDGMGIWDTDNIVIGCETQSRFILVEVPVNP